MTVEISSYSKPQAMNMRSFPPLGSGYLVGVTSPNIIEGTNLLSYTEIYANVPKKYTQPAQIAATIQQIVDVSSTGEPDAPPSYIPIDVSDIFDGEIEYEYAIDRTLIPSIFRSRLKMYPFAIKNSLQFGLDIKKPPADGRYLAGNSVTEQYLGQIYCRITTYVKPPPIKKWDGVVSA